MSTDTTQQIPEDLKGRCIEVTGNIQRPVGGVVLADLVDGVRSVVDRSLPPADTSALVAEQLGLRLPVPGLLNPEQCTGDPDRYAQHILYAADDGRFSIVALVWLPGQETAIHDHVSWCVVGVTQEQESETLYRLCTDCTDAHLIVTGTKQNPTGTVCAFAPPGDIHRVRNCSDDIAVSIHVYGADIAKLRSSVRRTYDHPVHLCRRSVRPFRERRPSGDGR